MSPALGGTSAQVGVPAGWPGLNDRVHVRLDLPSRPGEDEFDEITRVEDVRSERGGDVLVVAAPPFAGDLHVAVEGRSVTVAWSTPRGHSRQDFVITAVVRRLVPCWELLATGPVTQEQRRRYVRVPVAGRVVLRAVPSATEPDDTATAGVEDPELLKLDAQLVDLSEGGACVRATARTWVAARREVRVELDVDGSPVVQLAAVLRVRPAPGAVPLDRDQQQHDVVLEFVEPVPAADRVRRYVMRVQLENRRRGER
ncbi:PilZ domain-containing protein [Kineococcus rubinsiae]|uniref:PilZ domain-containing protein n=1 Tax=Kineococcus rubinsiae TaxID=2609562 RepID=UPI00142F619C|nr:PilZ domain-containing protein [Kineococcus rubinsiae]NIZ92299.1 hypothetical protein [Kineococcus rubinsiae]